MICSIAGNFEAGNSLNLAVTAVVGQHLRVTVHCYSRANGRNIVGCYMLRPFAILVPRARRFLVTWSGNEGLLVGYKLSRVALGTRMSVCTPCRHVVARCWELSRKV